MLTNFSVDLCGVKFSQFLLDKMRMGLTVTKCPNNRQQKANENEGKQVGKVVWLTNLRANYAKNIAYFEKKST